MTTYHVYTDGSCAPTNPGPGGWGFLYMTEAGTPMYGVSGGSGGETTTNNRMEVEALLQALTRVPEDATRLVVFTDSRYVLTGLTKPAGHTSNSDLWERVRATLDRTTVELEFKYTPAHKGVPGNEEADLLAKRGVALQ